MDIITQGLLGGVLAQSAARQDEKRRATVVGVLAGLLADADILIRSTGDPLLNIEYHRHFTHSLLFIPVGAAIAMALLWPFFRKNISLTRLYLFCLLGYSMSGILDACTSYGTHLFWPFSDSRIAFNIISIVDPVFTVLLLTALVTGLWKPAMRSAAVGLVACALYLGLGFVQQQRASDIALELAQQRGHQVTQRVVKPTLGNLVLWRSVYIAGDTIYIDAIRLGTFGANQVFDGESRKRFLVQQELPDLASDSVLYRDIARFHRFSAGYVAIDPQRSNVLGDMRYSMLPVSSRPLWGIVIDAAQPQQHASYQFFRVNDKSTRETFWNLLRGTCAKENCRDS